MPSKHAARPDPERGAVIHDPPSYAGTAGPIRRAMLAGSTAALLAGAAAVTAARAAPAVAGDDAELLRLCGEFHRLHAAVEDLPREATEDQVLFALVRRYTASDRILPVPAMTDAGRQAKASVAFAMLNEGYSREGGKTIPFVLATLRDIGGAVEPPRALETEPNPDAELIWLLAALVAQGEAMTRMKAEAEDAGILFGDGITPESEAHEEKMAAEDNAWLDIAKRIGDIPAKTSTGLHVKASATLLLLENCVCDSTDDTLDDIASGDVGEIEDRLALSIARDILAGRAVA